MRALTFEVPGEPVGKGRHRTVMRRGKGGQSYLANITPDKTASYESTVALFAAQAMAGAPLFEGALELNVIAFFARPKSHAKANPPKWVTKKPDASNLMKAVEDAMNGVVYKDDSQFAIARMVRVYDDRPRVAITITELAK